MALHRSGLACGLLAATILSAGCATDDESSTLDAIIPKKEALSVGMAGDEPADISRYLLASGASAPQLSPDGQQVIFGPQLPVYLSCGHCQSRAAHLAS